MNLGGTDTGGMNFGGSVLGEKEHPLAGGNTTAGVVRVGDTVRRPSGPRSAFVVSLLHLLERSGFPHAPRHLGTDERGRDVLTWIEGVTTDHPSQRAPGAYTAAGRMLRALHDVTAGSALAGDAPCVCHGDPGSFNTICRAGLPVAFIDWDAAGPGDPLEDLGYLAWTWCVQSSGDVPLAQQAEHLRELRDGYGAVSSGDLLDAVSAAQERIATAEAAVLASDPPAARAAHCRRAIAWAQADLDLVVRHRARFAGALDGGAGRSAGSQS